MRTSVSWRVMDSTRTVHSSVSHGPMPPVLLGTVRGTTALGTTSLSRRFSYSAPETAYIRNSSFEITLLASEDVSNVSSESSL